MGAERLGGEPPPRSVLRTAKVLLVAVIVGTLGGGSALVWPLLAWPMYHDRGETAPPATLSQLEVRAFDSGGEVVGVLKTSDVFGFERVPAGSAYLTDTFVSPEEDAITDRIEFLATRAEDLFDNEDIVVVEGWRLTWEVEVGTVPPLVRDDPTAEERLVTYERSGAETAP